MILFSNKYINSQKTEILKYYISKRNDDKLLDKNDIDNLEKDFEEIENINNDYSNNSDGEPEMNKELSYFNISVDDKNED